jgi:hypothetical protein
MIKMQQQRICNSNFYKSPNLIGSGLTTQVYQACQRNGKEDCSYIYKDYLPGAEELEFTLIASKLGLAPPSQVIECKDEKGRPTAYLIQKKMEGTLTQFYEKYAESNPEYIEIARKKVREIIRNLLVLAKIEHGDLWSDNILYENVGTLENPTFKFYVIDFEEARDLTNLLQNLSKISRTLAVAVRRGRNFYDVIEYKPTQQQQFVKQMKLKPIF